MDIPVFLRLVELVKKGFYTLDKKSQNEVREFVKNNQHSGGGFTDRGGHPDRYYSLFGVWLSVALDLQQQLETHKPYILQNSEKNTTPADAFASLLIRLLLLKKDFQKPSFLKLLKMAFREGGKVNIFYRLFLFLLAFDALYRKKFIWLFVRLVLFFYSSPQGSPCSVHAAVTVARAKAGLKTDGEKEKLLSFFDDEKGFKAFKGGVESDLLSTAVALFALKTAGADLRLVAPGCLNFIQQNYRGGAFLAGNGDEGRDLEYTFYGLLALGTLV